MNFPPKFTPQKWYVGCDPGFSGSLAWINDAGTVIRVRDMPVKRAGAKNSYNALNLEALHAIFTDIRELGGVDFGLENPTTRPGEGAERSARFGRQLGTLESFAFIFGLNYQLISPMLWKNRLGLPGKDHPGAIAACAATWERLYPTYAGLIRGPRGGVLDGRLDALLIAHFLRKNSLTFLQNEVRDHGKGSPEVQAAILGMGPGRRNKRPAIFDI